jgi:hypothetical protein
MQWVDDLVWERYRSWRGYEEFCILIKHSVWRHGMGVHVDKKAEEHKANYIKLERFKNSLPPDLQDCVNPFLDQQAKLSNAYSNIRLWLDFYR